MLPALENGPEPVQQFLKNFVNDTTKELFPTREACIAHYSSEENLKKLMTGEIGDNLMYRYRAIASFMLWPLICKAAMDATRKLIVERGGAEQVEHFEEFWNDFTNFELHQHAHGDTIEQVLTPAEAEMRYDIARWRNDGMPVEVNRYRLDEPETFRFQLTETGARELEAASKVWTFTLRGLTKMVTRIQMVWQIRDCVSVKEDDKVEAACA
jgi:hypothetical protein